MGAGPILAWKRFAPVPIGGMLAEVLARLLAALRTQALADRMRWPLWLPVAMGAGIGLYFSLPDEPAWGFAVVAAGLALVTGTLAGAANRGGAPHRAGAVGGGVPWLRVTPSSAPSLSARPSSPGRWGRPASTGASSSSRRTARARASRWARSLLRRLPPERTPATVRVSVRSGAQSLDARPMGASDRRADAAAGTGRARRLRFRTGRVSTSASARWAMPMAGPSRSRREPANGWREEIRLAVAKLRWTMTARIHAVLPGSTGGIASALITGDRGAISGEDEQALRDAGLAHVLAIAGLHMALVGLGLYLDCARAAGADPGLALRYPIKKWAALAALASATFYLDHQRSGDAGDARLRHAGHDAAGGAVRPPGAVDALAGAGRDHHPAVAAREPAGAGIPDVVRRGGQPDRRGRMGAGAPGAPHRAGRPARLRRHAPLHARHRHHQLGRQLGDRALRRLPFRPRHALRRDRQSAGHAGDGLRDHARRGACR